jgi:hypothetical protein
MAATCRFEGIASSSCTVINFANLVRFTNVGYWHKADSAQCVDECPLLGAKRTVTDRYFISRFMSTRARKGSASPGLVPKARTLYGTKIKI